MPLTANADGVFKLRSSDDIRAFFEIAQNRLVKFIGCSEGYSGQNREIRACRLCTNDACEANPIDCRVGTLSEIGEESIRFCVKSRDHVGTTLITGDELVLVKTKKDEHVARLKEAHAAE